jgi:hypothetical protein
MRPEPDQIWNFRRQNTLARLSKAKQPVIPPIEFLSLLQITKPFNIYLNFFQRQTHFPLGSRKSLLSGYPSENRVDQVLKQKILQHPKGLASKPRAAFRELFSGRYMGDQFGSSHCTYGIVSEFFR